MVGATICISARKSCTVLTTALSTVDETLKIVLSSNNGVTNAGKILYAPTANEDNGVLLQVVGHPRNISSNAVAVTQQNTSDLPECRVRFTGRRNKNLETSSSFLGT
jgi:hypothetical protein